MLLLVVRIYEFTIYLVSCSYQLECRPYIFFSSDAEETKFIDSCKIQDGRDSETGRRDTYANLGFHLSDNRLQHIKNSAYSQFF